MKLHNNTIRGVHQALEAIFVEGQYADKVIERTLKSNPKWGAKDRSFIAETTYEMVALPRTLGTSSVPTG